MKTYHTQGEWKLVHRGSYTGIISEDTTPIAGGFYNLNDEQYANARLIAAAPELLEALINLNQAAFDGKRLEEFRRKAEAAIKKATQP